METGLVSILMPVRNAEKYVNEALESILSQIYEKWELIIINDHSTDRSLDQINRCRDSRIRLFENTGSGIIEALCCGLKQCKGEMITRIDADDTIPPTRLQKMVSRLKKEDQNTLITGLVQYHSDRPVSEGYLKYEQWLNEINLQGNQYPYIYRECTVASPNWLMYHEKLLEMGGFNGLVYPEDYDLLFRWYKNKLEIICLPEITLFWREHLERTSRTSENYSQQAFFELKIKRFLELDYDHLKNIEIWGNNRKSKLSKEILRKLGVPFSTLKLDTKNRNEALTYSQVPLSPPENTQILLAVFPIENERMLIVNQLDQSGYIQGANYWFL